VRVALAFILGTLPVANATSARIVSMVEIVSLQIDADLRERDGREKAQNQTGAIIL
jgi:hypothetical protein